MHNKPRFWHSSFYKMGFHVSSSSAKNSNSFLQGKGRNTGNTALLSEPQGRKGNSTRQVFLQGVMSSWRKWVQNKTEVQQQLQDQQHLFQQELLGVTHILNFSRKITEGEGEKDMLGQRKAWCESHPKPATAYLSWNYGCQISRKHRWERGEGETPWLPEVTSGNMQHATCNMPDVTRSEVTWHAHATWKWHRYVGDVWYSVLRTANHRF